MQSRTGRIDVRLFIGIGVTVASVLGVLAVVTVADRTVPVYVLADSLATGDILTESSVRVVRANLGGLAELYLTPGEPVAGQVVQHPLLAGELLAKSALADVIADDSITTVLSVAGPLPASTHQGSLVDVWAAPDGSVRLEQNIAPAVVVSNAEVVRISTESGIAAVSTVHVELRLPRGKLQAVLVAMAQGLSFTLVTVGAR